MQLKDKIKAISKYCGEHHDHSNMVDEKNEYRFNVEIPEYKEIIEFIDNGAFVIILTGEAGDGKTRLLNNLSDTIKNFEIINDFSELNEKQRNFLISKIEDVICERTRTKLIIAANVGIFFQTAIKYSSKMLDLMKQSDKVKIINFQKRNIARTGNVINDILDEFCNITSEEACMDCKFKESCPFKNNIQYLKNINVRKNIQIMCDTLFLIGEHLTFRELLSLLSFMVTNGLDCETINHEIEMFPWDFFDRTDNITFRKFAKLDPILSNWQNDREIFKSLLKNYNDDIICEFVREKRKRYFLDSKNTYELLPIDYLKQFKDTIDSLEKPPYYVDVTENSKLFIELKKGLVKLISSNESDLNIQLYDTPQNICNDIKTRFNSDLENIAMVWNRKDFDIENNIVFGDNNTNNTFCLTAVILKDNERKLVQLTINYQLFKYIMLAKDNSIISGTHNISNEFGLSEFFRTILLNSDSAYDDVIVEFTSNNKYLDFEMKKYTYKDLFGKKSEKIQIKKI